MSYFRFGPIGSKLVLIEAVCCQDDKKKLSAKKIDFYYVKRVFERFWGQRSNQKIALQILIGDLIGNNSVRPQARGQRGILGAMSRRDKGKRGTLMCCTVGHWGAN